MNVQLETKNAVVLTESDFKDHNDLSCQPTTVIFSWCQTASVISSPEDLKVLLINSFYPYNMQWISTVPALQMCKIQTPEKPRAMALKAGGA